MSNKYIMYDPAEFDKIEINHANDADEITRLRAENVRLREALSYYAEEHYNGYNGNGACARAALEGVTETPNVP